MHLLLKVRTDQNRPSTQILAEVEVVAAEAKVVADLGTISLMIRSSTQVVEASLEARGAKEDVAEVPDRIHITAAIQVTAVTLNVITAVREDISQENVQRRRLITRIMEKDRKITMRLLADMTRTNVSAYLLCSTR